jgi:hypothetical protein
LAEFGYKRWVILQDCKLTEQELDYILDMYVKTPRKKRSSKRKRSIQRKQHERVISAIDSLRAEGHSEETIDAVFGT